MADMVRVSLIQPHKFRESKDQEWITYRPGIREMPLSHAKAMGLQRRIVTVSESGAVTKDELGVSFDERLTRRLNEAGITQLEQLRGMSDDEILSIQGVGPAAVERIHRALRGGE